MKKRGRVDSLQLSWDEIGFVCEGLSLSSRPLSIATKRITEEYSLGPRGAWMVLLINEGEVFPMHLTKIFQVGRSLITAELNRLADAKLITYRQHDVDGRRFELALTPLGQKVCAQVKEEIAKLVLERLKSYTREDVLLCARMLRDFRLPDTADAPAEYERSRLWQMKTESTAKRAPSKSTRAKRATKVAT
jgi:DNA-binding MarR family transcriptional regulator